MHIHFIGIGGSGMNGVAQLAAHAGHVVSGSDRAMDHSGLFGHLEAHGIKIVAQDGRGITEQTGTVVYSTAIEENNPDLIRARELNRPLLHRSGMLAKLCGGKELIAVAGSAGKSTVTGLLGWIFDQLGLSPTVYCGAIMKNFGSSVRFGSETGPWIIEADESDKSFLNFYPDHAVITNVAEDHFGLSELKQLFALFESQVSETVIHGGLDGCDTVSQATSPALIGKHNIENINNALALCKALGLDMKKCTQAIRTFQGIERRLERHREKVIDDFAHSPIKIAAALNAVSEVWPAFNAVWRPHGYTPLLKGLDGFIDSFSNHFTRRPVDRIFILPVYYAGGTVGEKITSEQFVEKLQEAGIPAEFYPDLETLAKRLFEEARPVLIMGARDPELPRFAEQIAEVIG